ncbi:MAG: hypothetical protein ACKO3W_05195 [bacterium]
MLPSFVFDALAFAGPVLIIAGVIAVIAGLVGARGEWEPGLRSLPQCARCSYDLRSTKLSVGNCPECGADLSKPDAVAVASRRVRRKLVALGVVLIACAGLAAWKLDAKGRVALRATLAEMSSTRANLDALFADGDAAPFAGEVLRARVGSSVAGTPRTIPADGLLDTLLDAVVEASDRHAAQASANDPLALLRRSDKARFLAEAIDDLELQRLEALAVEELLASNGKQQRLVRIADIAQGGSRGDQSRDRMKMLLSATPEGRTLLDWRPEFSGAKAWSIGTVGLSSVLRDPRPSEEAKRDGTLALIVEQVRLESIHGGAACVAPVVWPPERGNARGSALSVSFLADCPPGKYRLVFDGALVRNANVPRIETGTAKGMLRADFDVSAALKTEGAKPLAMSLEIDIAEPAIVPMLFSNDASKIDRVAKFLEYIRLTKNEAGEIVLDENALMKAAPRYLSAGSPPRMDAAIFLSMLFELRQRGQTLNLGTVEISENSVEMSPSAIDAKAIDLAQPFELVVTPTTMWNGEFNGKDEGRSNRRRGDAAWADYTLRFASVDAAPEVETKTRPLDASDGAPRSDAETRAAVERWARALRIFEPRRRFDGHILLRSSRRASDMAAPAANLDEKRDPPPLACEWPEDLVLSGWVEVRRDGQLIAERLRVAGPVDEWAPLARIVPMAGGPESRMDVARQAPWTASPLVIHYFPDARIGASDGSGPFAFVALPFELRELPTQGNGASRSATNDAASRTSTTDPTAPADRAVFELVWLEMTPNADGALDAIDERSK